MGFRRPGRGDADFRDEPLFTRHLADLIRDSPALIPAVIFYLACTAGLIYLMSWPALKAGTSPILSAAFLGAMIMAPTKSPAMQ